ncbi:uncharacterized protein ATC70_010495 [Mucor velutinosus]|uniref:Uncharacterized protein n=1 Tax=Mucor velutinosus TaxID=708070 RepID=A0AAN7DGI6_9FUNG|nr:hypothetical protein ATC70_010495 [Mucor velutinosus]
MQKSFASIALLLIAFLISVTQIAAASVEIQDDKAEVREAGFPVYDMYRSMYDQYYSRWVAHAMMMDREAEPAQFPPFPPFPPPPTFPPFPPPPTFPPFPPFPPHS